MSKVLAKSIIIHFETVGYASAVNGINNDNDETIILGNKKTYPYYLNLAGLPAKYNSDVIKTISLDTNEEIDILSENMDNHPITMESILTRGKVFIQLLSIYPNDILYMFGKFHDFGTLDEVIEYEDGKFLYWDKSQVESREVDLIYTLEQDVKRHLLEFDNILYTEVDDLYAELLQVTIYTLLVARIVQLRKANTETRQVSNFDLTSRFNSYYYMGKSAMLLPDNVKLWLYHSLPYLSTHIGLQRTFDDLVDNIVKPLGFKVIDMKLLPLPPTNDESEIFRVPIFSQNIFDITDGKVTNTNYYKRLLETNATSLKWSNVSDLGPKYEKEMSEYFMSQVKMEEDTRYFTLDVNKHKLKPLVNRTSLVYDVLFKTILSKDIHEITLSTGTIYNLTSKQLFVYVTGLLLILFNVPLNVRLGRYKSISLMEIPDNLTDNISNASDYDNFITDLRSKDIQNPTNPKVLFDSQLDMWNVFRDYIGLHYQPSYTANMEILKDRLTDNFMMDIDVNDVGEYLLDNAIYLPQIQDVMGTISLITYSVTGIVMDADKETEELLIAVTDIINKLTSYTIEGNYKPVVSSSIPVFNSTPSVLEGIAAYKVKDSSYDCIGAVGESYLVLNDDLPNGGYMDGTTTKVINGSISNISIIASEVTDKGYYSTSKITII